MNPSQLAQGPSDLNRPVRQNELPRLMDLFVMEALIAKVQVSLDEFLFKPSVRTHPFLPLRLFVLLLRALFVFVVCSHVRTTLFFFLQIRLRDF